MVTVAQAPDRPQNGSIWALLRGFFLVGLEVVGQFWMLYVGAK